MRLLLDTHALLWWLADDRRLAEAARSLIADPENEIFVSSVCLWEIAVKIRIGKLDADLAEILSATEDAGFTRLQISAAHLLELRDLPLHHKDPFDHLLIAQAICERASFVTEDRQSALYPVPRIACSGSA